jgi:tRNA uracil 4-sulfurtransferase
MTDHFIVHYDEIGLKGANRSYFEQMLMNNIKAKLGPKVKRIKRESGQITVVANNHEDSKEIKQGLTEVSGIAYFSPAIICKLDMDDIKKQSIEFIENEEFTTFKIDAKRHDKHNDLDSRKINNELGDHVRTNLNKTAKMKDPDLALKVEITRSNAYLSHENIQGVGGIPIRRKQKVVTLLSGGFDSPVAAQLMMKRGCEVIFVHFQNENLVKKSVENKILKLTEQLSKYQLQTKLYIVPFEELQKEIIMKVPPKIRMLIYRRFMIKISEEIAKQHRAFFLVTGDSLSQVASQTIENLRATYANSDMQILSPLIGMDKKEIIAISRIIGTHDISKLAYCDVCSYFLPKGPELKASTRLLDDLQATIDPEIVKRTTESAILKEF